jgi:ribosomal protein S18 acetylase RimI-like enzyme
VILISNYLIREMHTDEVYMLEDFLYEAIFQPDNSKPLSKDIIKKPEISVYIDIWGQKDDLCLVALVNKKIIGAVWTRILAGKIKGYGNIDSETPEFAISLLKEYRNQGIGTAMMKEMIALLKKNGYHRASLSVDKKNYACKMYKKIGFKIIEKQTNDYLMLIQLNDH